MKNLVLLLTVFLLASHSMALEQPKHRVLETIGKIELRDYEPSILAEVEVEGERSAAVNQAFRILAGYIFGGNQGQNKIAMTAPVTQAPEPASRPGEKIAMTAPVTQETVSATGSAGNPRWRVAFMMPSKFTLETLPKANDERIKFRVSEPVKRAAIVFDGFSTESNLSTHREQLEAFVAQRGLKIKGEYSMAFYNDPFTLPWNRRNEWWVAIE
ncbi:MAG: heme-binding protein [Betaproteobacteria bacterium]|nr:MAG: heme-binding protein [Betaproteobacteria bacterium]